MNILYIGDITSKLGRQTTAEILPGFINEHKVDFVIAQGENVSHGKGLQPNHAKELEGAGVSFFTGGNHSVVRPEYLESGKNAIRPANLKDAPGRGYALVDSPFGKILIISLEGKLVGLDANKEVENPLKVIDSVLEENKNTARVSTIVNFHGDYSSEKVVIGHYLDGRVSAVVGDHWHVPTADARVLPGGTAHITDVGMCGALDASLGVTFASVLPRWRDGKATRNVLETEGRQQFNAVLVSVKPDGLADKIEQIQK